MVDYSYIHKGRYYAHFTFNSRDLPDISSLIITYSDIADGYRVEYMRRLGGHSQVYDRINTRDKVTNVTLQISRETGKTPGNGSSTGTPFILADFLDERGVKGMAIPGSQPIPEIFETSESSEFSEGIISFWTGNEVLTRLVSRLASNFIVLYGLYGVAYNDYIDLVIPVPVQQTTALILQLKEIMTDFTKWDLKLLEITDYDMEHVLEEQPK